MQNSITIFNDTEKLHRKSVRLFCSAKSKELVFGMLNPEQYFKVIPPQLGCIVKVSSRLEIANYDFTFKHSENVIEATKLISKYGGIYVHQIRSNAETPWYIRRFATSKPNDIGNSKRCFTIEKTLFNNILLSKIIKEKDRITGTRCLTYIIKEGIPFTYSQLWQEAEENFRIAS